MSNEQCLESTQLSAFVSPAALFAGPAAVFMKHEASKLWVCVYLGLRELMIK